MNLVDYMFNCHICEQIRKTLIEKNLIKFVIK